MKKRFIDTKARELAKRLHEEEHKIIERKYPKNHELYHWYYLMASGIFQNLFNKIDDDNIEIHNLIVGLSDEINELKKQMKEVSKQQKYLWQTLEEKNEH